MNNEPEVTGDQYILFCNLTESADIEPVSCVRDRKFNRCSSLRQKILATKIEREFPLLETIMKISKIISVVALLVSGTIAFAQEAPVALDKPSFQASQSEIVTATVKAINHETREVTLLRQDGEEVTFTASEEARNLNQVSVGDTVVAEYIEKMTVQVMANDANLAPDAGGATTVGRTEEGEMPGVAAVDTVVMTATVEEINHEKQTFKLKGPQGKVQEYQAQNPENLKRAAVGDLVVITMSEAVAISVEKGPANN